MQDILTELTRLSKHSHNSSLAAYRQLTKRRHHSGLQPPQRANLDARLPAYLGTPDYTCSASHSSTQGVLHQNLLHVKNSKVPHSPYLVTYIPPSARLSHPWPYISSPHRRL